MFKLILSTSIVALLTLFGVADMFAPADLSADEVVPIRKYSGVLRQNGPALIAPKSGVIVGQAKFAEVWQAWSVGEQLPEVDFKTQMVLVATVSGPNRTLSGPLNLVDGELSYRVMSTKMGGPGFGYLLMLISRDGVKTVNGQPIPQPAAAKENPVNENAVADVIKVDVVGTVETGIMAVGGETTGAVIRANGVEWELDFQSAKQLAVAKKLGAKKARVRGTFLMFDGVERKSRQIVAVDSISDATPVVNLEPTREEILRLRQQFRDKQNRDKQNRDQLNGKGGQTTGQAGAMDKWQLPGVATNPKPKIDVSSLNEFSSISVTFSTDAVKGVEGKQLLNSQGNASLALDGKEEKWVVEPARLKVLHTLIGQTNWDNFPKLNRSNKPDVVNFTIEIKTRNGTTRIFVDSGALPRQPLINRIFDLMRKPASAVRNRESNPTDGRAGN